MEDRNESIQTQKNLQAKKWDQLNGILDTEIARLRQSSDDRPALKQAESTREYANKYLDIRNVQPPPPKYLYSIEPGGHMSSQRQAPSTTSAKRSYPSIDDDIGNLQRQIETLEARMSQGLHSLLTKPRESTVLGASSSKANKTSEGQLNQSSPSFRRKRSLEFLQRSGHGSDVKDASSDHRSALVRKWTPSTQRVDNRDYYAGRSLPVDIEPYEDEHISRDEHSVKRSARKKKSAKPKDDGKHVKDLLAEERVKNTQLTLKLDEVIAICQKQTSKLNKLRKIEAEHKKLLEAFTISEQIRKQQQELIDRLHQQSSFYKCAALPSPLNSKLASKRSQTQKSPLTRDHSKIRRRKKGTPI